MRFDHFHWCGMHHHGGVNSGERATLEHEHLAAGVADFLGGRADHVDRQANLIRGFRCGDSRANGHRGDHIVAAGMADARQAIVLGANGDVQRAVAGARGEGRRQIADAALNVKAGGVERVGEPAAGVFFFESEFRTRVNSMAQIENCFFYFSKSLFCSSFCIHVH